MYVKIIYLLFDFDLLVLFELLLLLLFLLALRFYKSCEVNISTYEAISFC